MSIYQTRRVAIVLLLAFWGGLLILTAQPVLGGTGLIEPPNTEKTTSHTERLKKRKDEQKLSLGESAKQRLASKCVASQTVIKKSVLKNTVNFTSEISYHFIFLTLFSSHSVKLILSPVLLLRITCL